MKVIFMLNERIGKILRIKPSSCELINSKVDLRCNDLGFIDSMNVFFNRFSKSSVCYKTEVFKYI